MSAICGHFAHKGKLKSTDLYDMLKKMEHRGPDENVVYLDGEIFPGTEIRSLEDFLRRESRIALGHSSLSIVGNGGSRYPNQSCDGKLLLMQSGEIYNYQKLRTLLYREHHIRTKSDSEVVVHLLEETYEGDLLEAVKKVAGLLDGMYTIAVTDGKSIVLARDPIGKKPLYFVTSEDVTYFASEKKALWNGKDEPERLNPGDILELTESGARVHEGYHLQMPQIDIVDFREAVDAYKDVLCRAITKRVAGLYEDTIGVIFSGGIDSVLVSKLLQREGKNIICYCAGTADSGDIQAARLVAEDLGLELKTAIIDEKTVEDILPEIIKNVEESGLLQVEVAIPMYLAAKMAAEDGVKIMFTGQAADELFAGYPWYNDVLAEHGYLRLHEKMWEDLNLSHTDTFEREDKLTMAHSIELRGPYMDRDVIQTSMRISPRLKLEGKNDKMRKRVHRQAAVELGVPAYLAFRIKDPAQTGSGIHDMVERIADRNIGKIQPELVAQNLQNDKGSIYRYGEIVYGEDAARFFLQKLVDEVQQSFTVKFLS
ncbi:MAG TPA: asparagine synthase-related protein [Desulfobacteraceae bacterium]|nr:asparagine synthase-related protein [Desulfobacteraceae bacterium]HPJ66966.1 asparagine synthase-related protein [Desulfobacteraceae bacterium]HPQ27702.1 asparagine synthase-related protein [Desulfobacteraceae bacterium]